jgi:hypothetical protein
MTGIESCVPTSFELIGSNEVGPWILLDGAITSI